MRLFRILKATQNSTALFMLVNILIVLLAEPSPTCATAPVLTLYSGDGRALTISRRNCPDLRALKFDDIATRAYAQGTWIIYEDYNYHGDFQLITNTQEELEHGLRNKVSSVRLVGSSDSDLDSTLTLYQGINFQGREVYNDKDNSNVGGSGSSLIVTGREPWTIYGSSNFGGKSICINPKPVYDTNDLKIPSVHSVRRGCFE